LVRIVIKYQRSKTADRLFWGGVELDAPFNLVGNSDADVILHAITNGVSGITGMPILGPVADQLWKEGITDSKIYLKRAVEDLTNINFQVTHVSVSVECLKPKLISHFPLMKQCIAGLLNISESDIGITATTGEGLTDFGKGLGVQAISVVTAQLLKK